jgi:alpha-amylase/alpha-mannosidase (GH57 family)
MVDNAFCVHGHFYQPPREDPLTGEIPLEPGAMPYRNWNERIHDQCYRPNAELGNFEHISFNIGPTLASWMEGYDPATLQKIIEQDRRNVALYGVGNAMAQAYNHTILPLSPRQDKETQVLWGIMDFEYRFGRKPQGMWLPETAMDIETLEVLAENGITFTILAPWQADVNNLDSTQPYFVNLPGGKKIIVFFYHQELSSRISFDPASTENADAFLLQKIRPQFRKKTTAREQKPQLILIASDGELYGHHQPFRDKFLSYLVGGALKGQPIQTSYPALWLKQYQPDRSVPVRPNTSWSCLHGVSRWSSSCSCTPHSDWKAPLREALNNIAAVLDEAYLKELKPYLAAPWQLRHHYIEVLSGKIDGEGYLRKVFGSKLSGEEVNKLRMLLASQYERQRMFTSCGWFFDDFDRIEPRNNLAYAAQAVWLNYQATGVDICKDCTQWLKPVKSWRSGLSADVVFSHHLERAKNYHDRWSYSMD